MSYTPATTTKHSEGRTYTFTTWTVGDHTISHVTGEEGSTVDRWITGSLNHDAPDVSEDTAHWHDETAPVTYTVNWSAWGDRTPTEARAYAARLMLAATTAEAFTAIRAQHK